MYLENAIDSIRKRMIDEVVEEVLRGTPMRATALADSVGGPSTFPGEKHWQIELVGPSDPSTLEALLDMANKHHIPVHRIVGTLPGLGLLSDRSISQMAKIARDGNVEFIATPISPLDGVEGKHPSEGSLFGVRLRSARSIKRYLYQMVRGAQGGLQIFLVWDEVILECALRLWRRVITPSVQFKVSIFGGVANSFALNNWLDTDSLYAVTSINPVALKVADFAELRALGKRDVPFDIHNNTTDLMDGLDRTREIHKIIKVAAPVNVKIERGENVAALMNERSLVRDVFPLVIKSAKKFLAHMEKYPELKMVEK